jgi:nucleoid-associated protein YgaU
VITEATNIVNDALARTADEVGATITDLAEPVAPHTEIDRPADDVELPASPPVATSDQTAPGGTWTIEPGDHLWHVAEHTLTTAWGHPPTDAEIAPYWQRLIDTNRDALADPDNPDLVFPGQVFELPPVG